MKRASAAEFVICNYAIIVTLCGLDSGRGILMPQCRIARRDFPLEPQKVTMSRHIETQQCVMRQTLTLNITLVLSRIGPVDGGTAGE
jgi:hypothetical protein